MFEKLLWENGETQKLRDLESDAVPGFMQDR
jgi:hypothetical protein